MNPVFIFLVICGAVLLWFLLAGTFYKFGRFLEKIWSNARNEITKEDNNKEEKENK